MTAGSVAWANMEYADTDVKAKSPRDTSKQDQFVVVEDGVVEVDVLDTKTNRRHTHTLWPKDFVYCNERPGAHPLDSAGQFASTVVLALRPVTAVPGRGRDRAFEGADPDARPRGAERGGPLRVCSFLRTASCAAGGVEERLYALSRRLKSVGFAIASAATIAASASSALAGLFRLTQ